MYALSQRSATRKDTPSKVLPSQIKRQVPIVAGMMEELTGVRVSAEYLSHRFRRAQKLVARETAALTDALEAYRSGGRPLQQLDLQELAGMREALRRMKAEVDKTDQDEQDALRKAAVRLTHAMQKPATKDLTEPTAHIAWKQVHTDSLVVDFLLREGYIQSAQLLAEEAGVQDFVDVEIFRNAHHVAEAILSRDIGPLQAWCSNHASKLRRIDSPLEFYLRKEEFLAMVLAGQQIQALEFAREHLAPIAAVDSNQLMRLMGALAFPNLRDAPQEFSTLLSDDRWQEMHDLFWVEMKKVYGIPAATPISSLVQMGLLALKTSTCMYPDAGSADSGCPVCSDEGRAIAAQLPNPYIGLTTLICRATGRVLDQNDPPVSLPNGQVLASSYVQEHKENGWIVCPFTNERFLEADVRPVYII